MKQRGAKLGQHFLRSEAAINAMVDAAHVTADSTIVEIGPGEGILTEALLATGARVIAIEKDSALAAMLHDRFADAIADHRLILIEDDFRNISISETMSQLSEKPLSYIVVANIPYYITGEIIRTLLTASRQPQSITLLIQKEVAERIVARDGKESILSLSVKAYGNPRIVRTVPRGSFSPPPSVDSAILCVEHVSREFFDGFGEDAFFKIVKSAFGAKRKQLAGNLRAIADADAIKTAARACTIDEKARAEDVPLAKWSCLAKSLPLK